MAFRKVRGKRRVRNYHMMGNDLGLFWHTPERTWGPQRGYDNNGYFKPIKGECFRRVFRTKRRAMAHLRVMGQGFFVSTYLTKNFPRSGTLRYWTMVVDGKLIRIDTGERA